MNDTSTVCHGNISIACHKKAFLVLLVCNSLCTVIKRLILFTLKIRSLVCLKYFVCFLTLFFCKWGKYLIGKCLCQIVSVSVYGFYLDISIIRVHTKSHVTWKCPWRCGPCEEVSIFSDNLETNDCRTLLDGLVSLCNFLRRKRSSATRAIRYDLKSLVQKLLVPDCLECPPLRLDEIVIVCDIWVIHISPETNSS